MLLLHFWISWTEVHKIFSFFNRQWNNRYWITIYGGSNVLVPIAHLYPCLFLVKKFIPMKFCNRSKLLGQSFSLSNRYPWLVCQIFKFCGVSSVLGSVFFDLHIILWAHDFFIDYDLMMCFLVFITGVGGLSHVPFVEIVLKESILVTFGSMQIRLILLIYR